MYGFRFKYKTENDDFLNGECRAWEVRRNACLMCAEAISEGMDGEEMASAMEGCLEIADIGRLVLGNVEATFGRLVDVYETCKMVYSFGYNAGVRDGRSETFDMLINMDGRGERGETGAAPQAVERR